MENGIDEILFELSPPGSLVDDASDHDEDDELLEGIFDDDDQMLMSTMIESIPDELTTDGLHRVNVDICANRLPSTFPDREWVIVRLEEMIECIVEGLLNNVAKLTITLKTRSNLSRRQVVRSGNTNSMPTPKIQEITYPGSNLQEAWRFTVLVRILELVHGALIDNTVMTKRDMYYRHPDLFVKQSIVDRYVDDIACTLGVPRSLLNVTAAAKGLVTGNFVINRADGSTVQGLAQEEGILIPELNEEDFFRLPSIKWVLVIEKEATFRSLLQAPQWQYLRTNSVVLTGKGYPDLASRKFLGRIANDFPDIPTLALVDYDPDGIAIMSTYKYGSYRLAHENVTLEQSSRLNLPGLQWVGVQSHHISRTPVNEGDTETVVLSDVQGLMRLTPRDRRRAQAMLEWDVCGEDGPEPGWRAELQRMLMLNVKAEMQILDELPGGLVSWLSNQLHVVQRWRSAVSSATSDDELLF